MRATSSPRGRGCDEQVTMRCSQRLASQPSQTTRIVALLRERSPNWVSLPEILELRISQYSARIHQARHEWSLNIENRTETINGKKNSWFRLVEKPAVLTTPIVAETAPLFSNTELGLMDGPYRDPEEGGWR